MLSQSVGSKSAENRAPEGTPSQPAPVSEAPDGAPDLATAARLGHDFSRLPPPVPRRPAPDVLQLGRKRSRRSFNNEGSLTHLMVQKNLIPNDPKDLDYEPPKVEPEDGPLTQEQRRMNERGWGLDLRTPGFSAITSNVEKYGARTPAKVKKGKQRALGETLDKMHPTVGMFQEVTNPDLFLHGDKKVPGLEDFDVHEAFRKKVKRGEDLPEGLEEHRGLGEEYGMLKGPAYKSGNYRESYPLAYDRSRIHQVPELFQMDPETHETQDVDGEIPFGKKLGKPRPTTGWHLKVSKDPFNLRPPSKDDPSTGEPDPEYAEKHANLSHRKPEYQDLHLLNVHTSPSISTIKRQVEDIEQSGNALRDQGHTVAWGGDHYMQRSARSVWNRLQETEDQPEGWHIAAPPNQTNFPGKGVGQTADHFVTDPHRMNVSSVTALPPPSEKRRALEDHVGQEVEDSELEKWRDLDIDHAPVHMDATFNPFVPAPKPKAKRRGRSRKRKT